MARPKRTQALFEVINANNSLLQSKSAKAAKEAIISRPGLIASSVSWFKNLGNKPQNPYDPTSASHIGVNDHSLSTTSGITPSAEPMADIAPAPVISQPVPVQNRTVAPSVAPQPVIAEPHSLAYHSDEQASDPTTGFISTASLAHSTALAVDRDRQQISLRLNYSSAIVGTVALIVVLALAYMIGSRSGTTTSQGSPTSEYLRSQPANPDLMNVGQASIDTQTTSVGSGRSIPATNDELTTPLPAPRPAGDRSGQTPPALSKQRVIGMNYVIVQTYPTLEDAKAAAEILARYNIETTIEQNLPDWNNNNWYSVVGLKSFPRTNNAADYDEYISTLNKISKKSSTSQFKQFQPAAYRWRAGK